MVSGFMFMPQSRCGAAGAAYSLRVRNREAARRRRRRDIDDIGADLSGQLARDRSGQRRVGRAAESRELRCSRWPRAESQSNHLITTVQFSLAVRVRNWTKRYAGSAADTLTGVSFWQPGSAGTLTVRKSPGRR
jgi:hypothetical protein